ncbi:MAG: hypothetical protein J5614_05610 [Paludibacteraceae bacterium]|nr:hypothetical protein [Paludibacteraceae bacterium]
MSHKDSSTDAAQRRIEVCLKASLDKNYRNAIISSDEELNGKRSKSSRKLAQILGPKDKRYNAHLNKVTQEILDIHGLTRSHFDIITRFEDELHASGGIVDNSIDANANKSNTTVVSLLSETHAPYKKLLGYRYIYREMKELYGTKRAQELAGMLYDYSLAINDSTNILIPYCFAMDASSIITVGRQFGQLHSAPAKRLSSYISILNEVVHSFTNQIAGALAVSTIFLDSAWLLNNLEHVSLEMIEKNPKFKTIYTDENGTEKETEFETVQKYIENCFQTFIYSVNSLSRVTYESPFTNVSIFSPSKIKALISDAGREWYIGGTEIPGKPNATENEKLEYMVKYIQAVQNIFMDIFDKGDPLKGGANFRFPVVTINVSKEETEPGSKRYRIVDEDKDFVTQLSKREIYRYNNMISMGTKIASCCYEKDATIVYKESLVSVPKTTTFAELYKQFKEKVVYVYQFGKWVQAKITKTDATGLKLYKIGLEDGTVLPLCTSNHMHYCQGGVYKTTMQLHVNEDFLTIDKSWNNMKSNPVEVKITSKEVVREVEAGEYVYCMDVIDPAAGTIPVFTLGCGVVTHNCRLVTNVSELNQFGAQINSFGGTAASYGSHRVVTINFPRLAVEATSIDDFIKRECDKVFATVQILHAHRKLLSEVTCTPALHPFFANGWIHMNRLFSTIGVIGIAEAVEIIIAKIRSGIVENTTPYKINKSLSEEKRAANLEALEDYITSIILTKLNDEMKRYSEDNPTYRNPFNIEEIPGEAMAIRLCEADRDIFNEDIIPYEMYSNQFVPLWKDASLWERMRADGKFNNMLSGGGIVHINVNERPTPEQVLEIYEYSVESGCEHFALNPVYALCKKGHYTFGNNDICPICGEPIVDKYTRIVGFFVPQSAFNRVRRIWEFPRRQFYGNLEKELSVKRSLDAVEETLKRR